jgi:hypothetical protein
MSKIVKLLIKCLKNMQSTESSRIYKQRTLFVSWGGGGEEEGERSRVFRKEGERRGEVNKMN